MEDSKEVKHKNNIDNAVYKIDGVIGVLSVIGEMEVYSTSTWEQFSACVEAVKAARIVLEQARNELE